MIWNRSGFSVWMRFHPEVYTIEVRGTVCSMEQLPTDN
jgi:hypothetical protein